MDDKKLLALFGLKWNPFQAENCYAPISLDRVQL